MADTPLKRFLKNGSIKQRDLQKQLGITPQYFSMIKHGHRVPGAKLAHQIEGLTGIPLRELLFPEESKEQHAEQQQEASC